MSTNAVLGAFNVYLIPGRSLDDGLTTSADVGSTCDPETIFVYWTSGNEEMSDSIKRVVAVVPE
jgi:hypothetical protein